MSLYALTTPAGVAASFTQFASHFTQKGDTEILDRNISFAGSVQAAKIRWYPEHKYWAMLQTDGALRYWCAFGIQDPHELTDLETSVEINIARKGIDKICGGLFVRSNHETTYLAHSGLVGGGTPGVGKIAFMKYYGHEEVDSIDWPDGKFSDYIILGALDSPDLRAQVGAFVHRVAEFRAEVKRLRKK